MRKNMKLIMSLVNMIKKVRGNLKRDLCSIGTLGGGNHYVEVNKDDEDNF